jgi:hypothetical protein
MLTRVRDFGTNYGQLFPATSLAQPTFAALAAAIDRIEAQQVAATTATVSASAARTSPARAVLIEQLTKVAATARVISESNADFRAHFKLGDVSNSQLLTTARGFMKNAAPFADAFVAHGMAPTFLEDLERSIEAFERARRERGAGQGQQTAARAGVRKALAEARAALRTLDVIVANHTGLDPAVRAVWTRDRRVSAPRQAKKSAEAVAVDDEAAA